VQARSKKTPTSTTKTFVTERYFARTKEAQMARKIAIIAFFIALVFVFCLKSNVNRDNALSMVSAAWADSCDPKDNMGETAESFIGRCCKGSIREVFPGEYLSKTMKEIQTDCRVGSRRDCDDGDEPSDTSARKARTAWKLLNRSEYRK
jgi:hypothetical protein